MFLISHKYLAQPNLNLPMLVFKHKTFSLGFKGSLDMLLNFFKVLYYFTHVFGKTCF